MNYKVIIYFEPAKYFLNFNDIFFIPLIRFLTLNDLTLVKRILLTLNKRTMADDLIDYSQIQLQENIPLSDEEIKNLETEQRKTIRIIPVVLGISTFAVMAIGVFCIEDFFSKFKYYEYILFVCGGLALFGFAYLISLLVTGYDRRNWKKDKAYGKNRLSSIVIGSDTTEYGEYLTFSGPSKNDKIRILVKPDDYSRYPMGTKVVVTYLKFSKTALSIIEQNR